MPSEDRRIIFDMSETYQALYKLSLKTDGSPKMIAGLITKVEEDGLDANKLNFFLENPQEGDKKMVSFSRDFVAASLMMFCRGAGIPMMRRAKKTVMIKEGAVILRVTI